MARIITVQFDQKNSENYGKLLKVFKYSVSINSPKLSFEEIVIPTPKIEIDKHYFMTKNSVKLEYWRDAILNSDEDTIIMDCDMMVLKDLSCIFDHKFDIACTRREVYKVPYNGGVIGIRPNERSCNFMKKWVDVNWKMYKDKSFHQPWRNKYAGMNQASFGWMIENNDTNSKLISLSCNPWNLCQEEWKDFDEKVKCVHIKSKLRHAVVTGDRLLAKEWKATKIMDLWFEYLKEAEKNE